MSGASTSQTWTLFSDAFFDQTTIVQPASAEAGRRRKRVIAVDVEHDEVVVVTEDAYRARDFRDPERVSLSEVLAHD